jgi:regulator of nucleoside diphosphate kinase
MESGERMNVVVRVRIGRASEMLRARIRRRLELSLARFGGRVAQVTVRVTGGEPTSLGRLHVCRRSRFGRRSASRESRPARSWKMKVGTILLTAHDLRRLTDVVSSGGAWPGRDREHLEALAAKLDMADVVSPEAIPHDVITIHSEVRVRHLDTGADATYTLAYPGRREAANAVSVLAPLGTALLGCREGDEVDWRAPGGRRRLEVLEVLYQPEAVAGRLVAPRETGRGPVTTRPGDRVNM